MEFPLSDKFEGMYCVFDLHTLQGALLHSGLSIMPTSYIYYMTVLSAE